MLKQLISEINKEFNLEFYFAYHKHDGTHDISILHENPGFTVLRIRHKGGRKKEFIYSAYRNFLRYLICGKTVQAKDIKGFTIEHYSIRDLIDKNY